QGANMSVKKEASGRRSVQVEVEVPGTPEEVWQAIATGPGISSWFVPTRSEEREGGKAVSSFGPGMDSVGTIKTWNPPQSFSVDTEEGPGRVATEWTVEARSGGWCVVRVVHCWFASTDDWDQQFEGHSHGWLAFFRILSLFLTHFRGQPSSAFQLMAMTPASKSDAWGRLMKALGFSSVASGTRVNSSAGVPPIGGLVERVGVEEYPELLVRLDQPTSGIAHLFAMSMGGQVVLSMRIYLYGSDASDTAKRDEPAWQAWIQQLFSNGGSGANSCS